MKQIWKESIFARETIIGLQYFDRFGKGQGFIFKRKALSHINKIEMSSRIYYILYGFPCDRLNINKFHDSVYYSFNKYIYVILLNRFIREELDEKKLSCPVLQ